MKQEACRAFKFDNVLFFGVSQHSFFPCLSVRFQLVLSLMVICFDETCLLFSKPLEMGL